MFAVIETGGKQYKVSEGDTIFVEKLGADEGTTVTFDKVLAVGGESFVTGAPYVAGATVSAKVVKNGKAKKIVVLADISSSGVTVTIGPCCTCATTGMPLPDMEVTARRTKAAARMARTRS